MIIKTKFKDLYLIKNKAFHDKRGYFKELIRENIIKKKFPFHVMSYSKKNVLRGLHLQTKNSQAKFITVVKGRIFDVAVDLRKKSKTYKKVFSSILSEKNSKSIFIPAGFAHGFLSLDKENFIVYSCNHYRDEKSELTIQYNDKSLEIKWPKKKFILSEKDKNGISISEFENKKK
ncbi:dTDP-4-dehydrorhamnose 3,5-epimerase [Candidatus Pelagibacter sp. HIMB1321]|uniref:dTDP-4-dehydrorhamnose 3,5-epimerase n=1 Tax=Candidatus Pelagibacter sp. HIMB1321 TaxID=1388755 RepID=UPI000A0815DD|nr:dTDP-4-dehydrorhamnose 3,5-epimerase [Candidatus Pelagibacter sp. HIMB1321]SMF76852.1 dTDP-4-dehydrorhamnose 3,5-epimerase [Candidatus Pelagibacter sp. HIMB1321]